MRGRDATQDFPLQPLHAASWAILVAIVAAVVIGVMFVPRHQATPMPSWLPLLLVLAVGIPLLALRRRRIRVDGRELCVAATFYTRRTPIDALDLDHARVVDLAERTELKPALKTNGFNLPFFQAGHYRLRNRAKAFCLLTDRERVLVLPQRDGRFILLSPEKPQALLDALRRLAEAAPRR